MTVSHILFCKSRMPSNRSRKDVFFKSADETLKRQLISNEFRKHIAFIVTKKHAKNNDDALQLIASKPEYIVLENLYNKKLADCITNFRHEIDERAINESCSLPTADTEKLQKDKERTRTGAVISKGNFDAYWNEISILKKSLAKYNSIVDECDDVATKEAITMYVQFVYILVQHRHGSPVPVPLLDKRQYNIVLTVYYEYKDYKELDYPGWPEEYITK